ncbi:Uncharacterised protein [Escherichia coli]|nr:Uncharacterised protein [Escherichia coli]
MHTAFSSPSSAPAAPLMPFSDAVQERFIRQIEPYTWNNVYSDVYNPNATIKTASYIKKRTPVIFRQFASSDVLQPLVILSIQIFSTAQYSIGFRNT